MTAGGAAAATVSDMAKNDELVAALDGRILELVEQLAAKMPAGQLEQLAGAVHHLAEARAWVISPAHARS